METEYWDISKDVTFEFVVRVRLHDDEIAITLKGHLLIEFLMNKILEKVPGGKPRNNTFAAKLQLIYSMGLIPSYLFDNINRINKLRNKLAHTLDFDLDKENMVITTESGNTINIYKKKIRYPVRKYLKMLCFITISQLERHMLFTLKIDPRFIT